MNKQIVENIENRFKGRAQTLGFKPGSKKYLDSQAEFFTGAMSALVAISENFDLVDADKSEEEKKAGHGKAMPPNWVFSIMRGDQIVSN